MPQSDSEYGATDDAGTQHSGTDAASELDSVKMGKLSVGVSQGHAHSSFNTLVALLCTATIAEGYDLGVMNAAVVQIQDHFGLDAHQVGIIVAVTPVFAFIGALLMGAIADNFGRRWGLVATCLSLFFGPIIIALAEGIVALVIGRALCGIGIGGGMLIVTMYIAELAPAAQRGRLVASTEVALNFGMVLGYFMGWMMLGVDNDWRWMILLGALLPMPLIAVLLAVYVSGGSDNAFLPETPRWLVQRGHFESAYRVLERFMGTPEAIVKMRELQSEREGGKEKFISWSEILCAWHNGPLMRMLLTGILVAVGEMFCGGTSVGYYSSTIMTESLGKSSAFFATAIMGCVRFGGVICATCVIDSTGRRTLLLSSAAVMTIACIWVAFTAHYHDGVGWMLAGGLWLMMLGFVMGLGSVSLVYISEIFPTRIRQKGMVVCMFWARMSGSAGAMAYPVLIQYHGISLTFCYQAAINLGLLGLIWLMVRETNGLSLEDAYKLFDGDIQKIDDKRALLRSPHNSPQS